MFNKSCAHQEKQPIRTLNNYLSKRHPRNSKPTAVSTPPDYSGSKIGTAKSVSRGQTGSKKKMRFERSFFFFFFINTKPSTKFIERLPRDQKQLWCNRPAIINALVFHACNLLDATGKRRHSRAGISFHPSIREQKYTVTVSATAMTKMTCLLMTD